MRVFACICVTKSSGICIAMRAHFQNFCRALAATIVSSVNALIQWSLADERARGGDGREGGK